MNGDDLIEQEMVGLLRHGVMHEKEVRAAMQRIHHAKFEFLSDNFLEAMNDIGRYGFEKYGSQSFQVRRLKGDASRGESERTSTAEISRHAGDHFEQYQNHVAHDHFGTDKHQLAAVAFNAMMEFYFAGLEDKKEAVMYGGD